MRGRKALRPLDEVADAAVTVFAARGYRNSGISDVAAQLGLSHGALYTYVQSKQSLLYLALLRATDPAAVQALSLPVEPPTPESIAKLLEAWVTATAPPLFIDRTYNPSQRLTGADLGSVIDDLYDFMESNRQTLDLIEKCAADLPELAQWFFIRGRRAALDLLGNLLRTEIKAKRLAPVPDIAVAARFINETIAWFAMHRHGDFDGGTLDDDACRATVRHLLLTAFQPTPARHE